MIIYKNNKKISVDIKKVGFFGKIFGLIFRTRNTKNLLFEFKKPTRMAIHSFFVFFEFVAVWLDGKNKIIEIRKIKPFSPSVKPSKRFFKLVEIPLSRRNARILKILVGEERFKKNIALE